MACHPSTRIGLVQYTFKKKCQYGDALDYDVGGFYARYTLEYKSVREVLAIADAPAPTFLTSESDGLSTLGTGLMIAGILAVAANLAFCASAGCALASRGTHDYTLHVGKRATTDCLVIFRCFHQTDSLANFAQVRC